MNLNEVKFRDVNYLHRGRDQIVRIITCDPEDGACLIAEPSDGIGDIMGGDLFRCEAYELRPVDRAIWERKYPARIPGNLPFEEMNA